MIFLLADSWLVLIVLSSIFMVLGITGLFIFMVYKNYEKTNARTQAYLTDREILLFIAEQPDGMMTAERLAENSALTKKQAKSRLTYLFHQSILDISHDGKFKSHYSLKDPIDDRHQLELSEDPFLTVEDVLLLFKHHNFKLTFQKACISTGLPVAIIKREFNYFTKQKIMTQVYSSVAVGQTRQRFFLLEEPYRSNPDKFLEREKQMNLELEKIYIKKMKQ